MYGMPWLGRDTDLLMPINIRGTYHELDLILRAFICSSLFWGQISIKYFSFICLLLLRILFNPIPHHSSFHRIMHRSGIIRMSFPLTWFSLSAKLRSNPHWKYSLVTFFSMCHGYKFLLLKLKVTSKNMQFNKIFRLRFIHCRREYLRNFFAYPSQFTKHSNFIFLGKYVDFNYQFSLWLCLNISDLILERDLDRKLEWLLRTPNLTFNWSLNLNYTSS